jgi:hypothetical protein
MLLMTHFRHCRKYSISFVYIFHWPLRLYDIFWINFHKRNLWFILGDWVGGSTRLDFHAVQWKF